MSRTRRVGSSERREARTHPAVPRRFQIQNNEISKLQYYTSSSNDEIPFIRIKPIVIGFPRNFRIVCHELGTFCGGVPHVEAGSNGA